MLSKKTCIFAAIVGISYPFAEDRLPEFASFRRV